MTLRKLGMKRIRTRRLGDRFSTGLAIGLKKTGGMAKHSGQILTQVGALTGSPGLVTGGTLMMSGGNVAEFGGEAIQSMKSTLEK